MIPTEKLERLFCILVLIFVVLFLLVCHTGCRSLRVPPSDFHLPGTINITLYHRSW